MANTHPWKLVAPWYRWQRQLDEEGLSPRQTHPVFQKFDQADFVKGFVRDPQHSLKFIDEVDRVFNVNLTKAPPLPFGSPLKSKYTRLFVPKSESGALEAKDATLVPTGIRKLYLATHKRHYVVVCELHCDAAGFPTVTPDQVCQTGFVVRRRSHQYPKGAKKEAVKILRKITAIHAEIAYLEQTSPTRGLAAKRRAKAVQKMIAEGAYQANLRAAKAKLAAAREELSQWRDANGVTSILEGWIPGPFEKIGSWQIVEETPQQIVESTTPLFAVFPDPNILDHSALGKNIYFGAVPTSSLDTDGRGEARFDDLTLYEIRCFVRRHKPDCPRRDEAPDCQGEIVWSEPTEIYKLASHHDLRGTAQQPVTIQMPDLAELAAQAASMTASQFAPVKVVQPQALNFSVNDGKPESLGIGGKQICFFAIPLITIVAFFVLKLFLPVLVFLFGLFFLLQLKLCILPSVAIDVNLEAELEALPPGIDVDIELDVSIGFTAERLNGSLREIITDEVGKKVPYVGVEGDENTIKLEDFSNTALLPVGNSIKAASDIPEDQADKSGPDLLAALEFEPRVEVRVL
ncbi:MAG TPA: hypothetical protein VFY40_23160 [Blastocatellia bacterium]|nr:hypothetical protein [Blastocatellia bacterium]